MYRFVSNFFASDWDLQVPHAESGKQTVIVEVSFPAGIVRVRPRNKIGWNTTIEYRPLPTELQYNSEGEVVNVTASKVTRCDLFAVVLSCYITFLYVSILTPGRSFSHLLMSAKPFRMRNLR